MGPPGFDPHRSVVCTKAPGAGLRGLRALWTMAPSQAPSRDRAGQEDEDRWEARGDRKVRTGTAGRWAWGRLRGPGGLSSRFPQARKPLVEKKRRARINESLQELRLLLAGTEVRRKGGGGRGEASGCNPEHTAGLDSLPLCAGAGQARERRGSGADREARAGRAARPGAR